MTQIRSRPLLGLLLNPFGKHARGLECRGNQLLISGRNACVVHLEKLATAPIVESWGFLSTLAVTLDDGTTFTLKGACQDEAASFAQSLTFSWIEFNTARFESEEMTVNEVVQAIDELSNPTSYPSACLVAPVLTQAKQLDQNLLSKLPREAVSVNAQSKIRKVQSFAKNAIAMRDQAISRFEAQQLSEWKEFFDTFESNPLTREQRTSIIADEDATLVLAGAGSGKTSVITAKAGYLLKSGIRKPEEILLLAFAKDAANEMSERIEEKCGVPLDARTFHSLAYDIIGAVEGSKPALAAHATDDKAFLALIKDILRTLVRTATEVSRSLVRWFSHARFEDKSEWDFNRRHDYYTYIEKMDLRTLQGEKVKSFEELMIANWLFENGIEYEYEPDYEHKVSEGGYRDYCPDFRLTKSGAYIEHFGVRRRKASDGTSKLTTAPFVNGEEYLESMEWKRGVHAEHETTLIETFSYERQEDRFLEALAEKIAPHETVAPRSVETLFDRIAELNQVDSFVQLVGTFLRHYKGGGYCLEECAQKCKALKLGKRANAFLSIFEPVYAEYQKRLGSRIDFEDMMLRASHYAESGQYLSPFKHILVDEFQDISRSRGRLVKALKTQYADARLFAVGDDWQSIYRFAGSDINLMRKFGEEFGGTFDSQSAVHRTVDLGRTFRSVDQIAHAAKRFVLQNPTQLKKTVIPAGNAKTPALRVVSTFRHDAEQRLTEVLRSLPVDSDQSKKTTVLLLGRYRHLAPNALPRLRREFSHLNIAFKTIHSSKGLEAEHVVVLGLFRGRTGFPSEIVDDSLLNLVSPDAELFENAEERRVMYVALTRARLTVTLMGFASRQSAFVTELLNDPEYGFDSKTEAEQKNHTCGECGGLLLAFPTKDGRSWYRCEHSDLCGFSLNACSKCARDLPTKTDGSGLMKCTCGAVYKDCPKCKNGWLVERNGRYGRFMGCVSYPRCKGKMKAP